MEDRPEPGILRRRPRRGGAPVDLPARRVVLPNGLRLLLLQRTGAPVLAVRAHVDCGMLREARPGIAAFAGECLDEGAGGRTGPEISAFLEARGAALQAGPVGASLRCLAADAGPCLDVLADVILRPDFAPDVVERERGELIADVLSEDDDPAFVGSERFRAEVYGPHPWARRDKGGIADLRALGRDDLAAHHRAWCVPRNAIVSAVGSMPADEMEALLTERFGGWADRAPPETRLPDPPSPHAPGYEPRTIRVEQDREQLHVYLGHLGVRRTDPDYHALLVGDVILGSSPGFTDRLSRKIRDEMGLAYTVWARIARGSDLEPGVFLAYIGTSPSQRETALAAMREEIRRFVEEGVTDRELDDARSYLLGSYVFGFETVDQTAEQLVQLERLGLGFRYPAAFAREIRALTRRDVEEAVRRHVFPDRLTTVMVGRLEGHE